MKKIIFIFGFLFVCALMSAAELKQEYCYVLFPVDSQPLKKINMCLSYQSREMAKIPLNADGVTVNLDEYACYNAVFNAIKTNSVDGIKPFIYEPAEAKQKQISGLLKILNNYWNNISKNTMPQLVKIIQYGDSKAFFIRCRNPETSKVSVLYIPIRTVNGQDFFIDAPDEMNPPFLSVIANNLTAGENFYHEINAYQYQYPIIDGKNSVILYFNGSPANVDLTKDEKQESSLLTFAQNAYQSMSQDYNCYPDFYSAASAKRISQSISANQKTKDYLGNGIRNYTKISFVINAQPIYILFYEFPAVGGQEINYVLDHGDHLYRFVNFSSYNPVSEIISKLDQKLIPQTLKK